MTQGQYSIKDAAMLLEVEPHVLRYWEEELELLIPRNEMGHRYYREQEIVMLRNIKLLKQQGFQLKAIRLLINEMENGSEIDIPTVLHMKDELNQSVEQSEIRQPMATVRNFNSAFSKKQERDSEKMEQFHVIMTNIMQQVMRENNQMLYQALTQEFAQEIADEVKREVTEEVTNRVCKEMNYALREQEERQEEHLRRLDEAIRSSQKARQEIAAASERKRHRFFSKYK